jgi:hypothetical protein
MPFFVDMAVANNARDGVWYFANGSYLAVEWRTSNRGNGTDLYDFSVEYSTSSPGVYVFRYYVVGEYARIATVGAQSGPTGECLRRPREAADVCRAGYGVHWADCDRGRVGDCVQHARGTECDLHNGSYVMFGWI